MNPGLIGRRSDRLRGAFARRINSAITWWPVGVLIWAFWLCPAAAQNSASQSTLENHWIAVRVQVEDGRFDGLRIEDRENGRVLNIPDVFSMDFAGGQTVRAKDLAVTKPLATEELEPAAAALRQSEREGGRQACLELAGQRLGVSVRWCGILRRGSPYFRQQFSIRSDHASLPLREVRALELDDPGAHVAGTVAGSPVVDGTMFFGFEHPLSSATVENGRLTASLRRVLPLQTGETVTYSSVIGVAPAGQMRRAFLDYLERERPRPYRPFLHYNSWYDLGDGNDQHGAQYDDAGAVERIRAFGNELTVKRHVVLDSFLFDDGWDDTNSLWGFSSVFRHGFAPEEKAAAAYQAGIGVWLSPWGGYGRRKQERIAFGSKQGYEILRGGFALSGPKYYSGFEQACLQMIQKYGVNFFKFDGTGNADQVFAGSRFDSDFAAAIHLMERLRQQRPDVFINLTTGTYPSPFWLLYADSIWRGGDDHNFTGKGSSRQRWITYRDAQTYKHEVLQGPLFPLNSLMLHGLIYARYANGLQSDPRGDFPDEVRSYFGSGTQLQEMYITPSLLSSQDWDTLAQAAIWARKNSGTLKDTHWIGGDPAKLEVYGWAAWSSAEGIVVLRNPSDQAQAYSLDVGKAFELPAGAPRAYSATNPWETGAKAQKLRAGEAVRVELKPFEVRTLDALPVPER